MNITYHLPLFRVILILVLGRFGCNSSNIWPSVGKIVRRKLGTNFVAVIVGTPVLLCTPTWMHGTVTQAAQQVAVDPADLKRLRLGLREVSYLLEKWDEKTTYCNFGEFQRELLLPENKERLFQAARETGLLDYDKSKTMNVMCRKDPEVVRAFLGLTKENLLLAKADDLMKKPSTLSRVDPDKIDQYFEDVETYMQAVAMADTLAYQARTDYSSTETATKESYKENSGKVDYLTQSKSAVEVVQSSLSRIVDALGI
jgi:hypothetical protein